MELRDNERIDRLYCRNLNIIQSRDVFRFSLDAVLLARFATVPKKGKIADLCTGNGIVPLLLSTRTDAEIVGIEIQERLTDMAKRSVRLNRLENRIRIVCGDVREIHRTVGCDEFDLVTVNPPYWPAKAGVPSANRFVASARHELHGSLDEIVAACSRLVRSGGKVAMVHRPQRLADVVAALRSARLEPKRMRFVHPRAGSDANMVLVEAVKAGKPDLRVLPPLIVFTEDNRYSEELQAVFEGRAQALSDDAVSPGFGRDGFLFEEVEA
ncbi:MAG: SAM-dependent methyltransferase [Candidatus Reconcilbacillus cellulovorans]|uniref:SAM-dependent methyltransferase n=1 Tax=Candidatus Reconcilbacillus cellulovorans TaxID=1906605 RepID=A0A2A6E2R4_9BACL|nr:MAG: SAM-dependent methyltransferase [Candidatus Reconcilbacillus cellulovorans]